MDEAGLFGVLLGVDWSNHFEPLTIMLQLLEWGLFPSHSEPLQTFIGLPKHPQPTSSVFLVTRTLSIGNAQKLHTTLHEQVQNLRPFQRKR